MGRKAGKCANTGDTHLRKTVLNDAHLGGVVMVCPTWTVWGTSTSTHLGGRRCSQKSPCWATIMYDKSEVMWDQAPVDVGKDGWYAGIVEGRRKGTDGTRGRRKEKE